MINWWNMRPIFPGNKDATDWMKAASTEIDRLNAELEQAKELLRVSGKTQAIVEQKYFKTHFALEKLCECVGIARATSRLVKALDCPIDKRAASNYENAVEADELAHKELWKEAGIE